MRSPFIFFQYAFTHLLFFIASARPVFSIRINTSAILYCVSTTGGCMLKFSPSINLSVLSKLSIMVLPSQFNVTAISPEVFFRCKKTAACAAVFRVGIDLSSRSVSRQVLSALVSLTSVFGMGTGGPSPLKTPTIRGITPSKLNRRRNGKAACITVGQALGLLVPVG